MFLTAHITVCICLAELKGYLLTYLPRGETTWGETFRGKLTKGQNVHKSYVDLTGSFCCDFCDFELSCVEFCSGMGSGLVQSTEHSLKLSKI